MRVKKIPGPVHPPPKLFARGGTDRRQIIRLAPDQPFCSQHRCEQLTQLLLEPFVVDNFFSFKRRAQCMHLWRDCSIVWCVTFEERRAGSARRWFRQQAISRQRQAARHFLLPSVWKPENESLDSRGRSDLDRVRLPVVQDEVAAV